jgi:hypothetical protein
VVRFPGECVVRFKATISLLPAGRKLDQAAVEQIVGGKAADAALMADDAQIDLAQARRLIALGCPLETATRILL